MEGLVPGSDGDVIKAEGDLLARTVDSEPQKLRHHLRLVSADGLRMAAPNLDDKKWPEIGEESRRKDKAKDDVLREMRKAVADKNLDSLQVVRLVVVTVATVIVTCWANLLIEAEIAVCSLQASI